MGLLDYILAFTLVGLGNVLLHLIYMLLIPIIVYYSMTKLHNWKHNLPPSPLPLPIIGHFHLLGPLIHHSFRDLSSRYGPLIRLKLGSVSCVVASTPELARELLKTNELAFSARKHTFAIDQMTYSSSFAFAPYGPYWKFMKKICTVELLGNRMLNHFLPIRANELHQFLKIIYSKSMAGESVNVTEELMKLSNNIISCMMFGVRSSGTDGQAELARNLVREVTELFGEFNVSDFIWICKNLDLKGSKYRIEELHRRYDDFLEGIISTREVERKKKIGGSGRSDEKDFLDILLDVKEDDTREIKLTREHIKALVLDILTAATDTTAITLEWALAELINHPRALNKARDEIIRIVGTKRVVEESDGPNLPYIQAVLKETFRLHPPIPMVARKSTQGCKINGYDVPPGTLLFVNMWAIGRDPKYWENPMDFVPERFLETSHDTNKGSHANVDVKGQNFELLPFGSGRRSCPGMSLALQELPVTLAGMVQCFDWDVINNNNNNNNGLNGGINNGNNNNNNNNNNCLDMAERPGLTAPRATDLVCLPVARMDMVDTLHKL